MTVHDIALTLLPRIGPKTAGELIAYFGSAENVLRTPYSDLIASKVQPSIARILRECSTWDAAEQIIEICASRSVHILVKGDERYPELLSMCLDAPHVLYVMGSAEFNSGKWAAVVGTRKATVEGVAAAQNLVKDIASCWGDSVIVSGLAFGIDKTAHLAAMDAGLKTVAVMAGWVEDIVPPTHHYIARRILNSGGSVVSDMPPGTVIVGSNFISRNRIIAGLAHLTVVAESAAKGGSLITADIASSYNRPIFAIPGRSSDSSFAGTNALIKSNKAIMYQDLSDIAAEMGWERPHIATAQSRSAALPDYLLRVFEFMESNELYTLDAIAENCLLPLPAASSALIALELRGFIKTMQGGLYQKTRY